MAHCNAGVKKLSSASQSFSGDQGAAAASPFHSAVSSRRVSSGSQRGVERWGSRESTLTSASTEAADDTNLYMGARDCTDLPLKTNLNGESHCDTQLGQVEFHQAVPFLLKPCGGGISCFDTQPTDDSCNRRDLGDSQSSSLHNSMCELEGGADARATGLTGRQQVLCEQAEGCSVPIDNLVQQWLRRQVPSPAPSALDTGSFVAESIPLTGTILADRRIIFYRTQMCPHVARGQCRLGAKCRFAHRREDLRPPPRLDKTRICSFIKAAVPCPRGSECSFAHSRGELRHTTAFFKTNMCRSWLAGRCLHPATCNHAHGMQELLYFRTVATQSGARDFSRESASGSRPLKADGLFRRVAAGASMAAEKAFRLKPSGGANAINLPSERSIPTGVHGKTEGSLEDQNGCSMDELSDELLQGLMLHMRCQGSLDVVKDMDAESPAFQRIDHRQHRRRTPQGLTTTDMLRKAKTSLKMAHAPMLGAGASQKTLQQRCPPALVGDAAAVLLQMLQGTEIGNGSLNAQCLKQGCGMTTARALGIQRAEKSAAVDHDDTLQKTAGGCGGNPGVHRRTNMKSLQPNKDGCRWEVESAGSTDTVSSTAVTYAESTRMSSVEWLAAESLAELLTCDDVTDQQRTQDCHYTAWEELPAAAKMPQQRQDRYSHPGKLQLPSEQLIRGGVVERDVSRNRGVSSAKRAADNEKIRSEAMVAQMIQALGMDR